MDTVDVKKDYCIIVENTVTGICNKKAGARGPCNTDMKDVTVVPSAHLSFSGTVSTTNVIMASWSKMMWQSIVNRAVRKLASRPFGSHFFFAVATVSGN
ncbi:hypothetical protein KIN20_016779 [Parelaphostrongylus tenuis]|uniref:Uncharacterized protein n=1 Tax=Parelaphostrongylus tenuis TaxID=148309 RepID=A0AAD5QN58_PARTN|nr:hypothetical protein KIN20_016779 [Parelaphostrongylus tenuis]